ncbi:oncostatin-M-specific receptor subunit beta isoform X2 [Dunckerocampus dactyliophorus]|uniref:oncostatin-M-specific receptor subunit beta isoform X2 n=1 Tax=Dunckerocampus dactyliophorus TaxID=161453 RepID=UPI00240655CE|nr:oncostatin-M-specific receptor subunit beta isoform X2 [Dunckerocampus dactyliophorus]
MHTHTHTHTQENSYLVRSMDFMGWISARGYVVMLLMFPLTVNQGSACDAPSSPQCFRRNKEESVYKCEWHQNTTEGDATFDLRFSFCDKPLGSFRETHAWVNEEQLIRFRPVDVWVEAHVGDSKCTSNKTSVLLSETVKFEAPRDISVSWTQNHLSMTWTAAEKHPAMAEVWFRKAETQSWEKRRNLTEFTQSKNLMYQLVIEDLQKRTSYQVQLRHQTTVTRYPLWSDWSPLVIVPAELERKLDVNMTLEALEGFRKVTLLWKPVHHATAVSGLTYILKDTQSPRGCPCKKKPHSIKQTEHTEYVSYSPVSISVIARNAAGSSPEAVIQVPAGPAPDLKPCDKTLLNGKVKKSTCLEWYELQDGDLRPESVRTLTARTTKRERKLMRNSTKDYVGYLYYEHLCVNKRPKTVNMCLFYQKENVPKKAPQDLFVFNQTHNSATLSWKTIPTVERRGFLTHYNMCSVKINSQGELKECHSIPASLVTYRLENLRPEMKYNISLAGVTTAGEGPKATVTINTLPLISMNEWLKLGLVLAFLFILLLVVCACICKRMKKNILPPVPEPSILDFSSRESVTQEWMQEEDEEVEHGFTLQLLHPTGETLAEDAEDTAMSLDIAIKRLDPVVPEETNADALIPSSTAQTLRDAKKEIPNTEQEDLLALLLYRKGLVFDMKTDLVK